MREETGNRIILFSFVLTVFVIWLHAGESLISSIPGQIAVPGFFILSGFLFFRNAREEGAEASGFFPAWMGRKLLRRIRTLLVPYLVWNTVYYGIYLIAGKATLAEFPRAVLLYSCNPVFWYLFQLNLITAVTPLLYGIMKKKQTAVLWLAVIFTAAVFYGTIHAAIPVSFINEDALFYYSAGAFLSMHVAGRSGPETEKTAGGEPERRSCAETEKLIRISAGACAGLLLLFTAMQRFLPGAFRNAGVIGQRLSGALLVWFLTGLIPAGKLRIRPWMRITFFIYATHYMVIRAAWAAETALGLNGSAAANIATYLLMPAVCVAVAYGIYILMKKTMPKVLRVLTGGRGEES